MSARRFIVEKALQQDRSHKNTLNGSGSWDVADVMAIVGPFLDERKPRPPQHIDLQKERILTNNVAWGVGIAAWLTTVRALVTRDRGWMAAAAVTWGFGYLLGIYERGLDEDLEAQKP